MTRLADVMLRWLIEKLIGPEFAHGKAALESVNALIDEYLAQEKGKTNAA